MNGARKIARSIVLAPMRAWHSTSSMRRPCCRYVPSCAEYGIEAVEIHGVLKGLSLSLRRVSKCHPWGGYGPDPVPAPTNGTRTRKAA